MNAPFRSQESPSLNPAFLTPQPRYVPTGTKRMVLGRPPTVLPSVSTAGTRTL